MTSKRNIVIGATLVALLAVLGTGIWIGVQHLGYLEFGEIRRVAQRTIEQRHIFVNNLAIRRATEELRVARDFQQVSRILTAAFDANDFDAFELRAEFPSAARGFHLVEPNHPAHLRWQKAASFKEFGSTWSISLDLVSAGNLHCGSLIVFRRYTGRDLQLDINLLTSTFATTLADALQRTAMENVEFMPDASDAALLPAQAG
jgi:hypothetical protein